MRKNMSNYLNFAIQDRDSLCVWILRTMGHPHITIELTADHLNDCIDDAVEEFTKYVQQERAYMAFDLEQYPAGIELSGGIVSGAGFDVPHNVTGIYALEAFTLAEGSTVIGSENTIFSLPNQLWNLPGFTGHPNAFTSPGSFVTYEAAKQFLDLTQKLTASEFYFEFNPRTHKLVLTPDPSVYTLKGHVAIGVTTIRPDEQQYGESWVKRYALAMAKMRLGTIRSKWASVNLMATGTVDTSMKEEGLSERDALREELWNENQTPTFFIG